MKPVAVANKSTRSTTSPSTSPSIRRNIDRFPSDFMFQQTKEEMDTLTAQLATSNLKSQFAFSRSGWGGRRTRPRAFTEQGVAMLSSVLRSKRAVQVNIEIMRAFVRLRRMVISHEEMARRVDSLEKKYDAQFKAVFDAIRQLMAPPEKARRPVGFRVEEARAIYRARRRRGVSAV